MAEKMDWKCSRAGSFNGIATGGVDTKVKVGDIIAMKEDEAAAVNAAAETDASKAQFVLAKPGKAHAAH